MQSDKKGKIKMQKTPTKIFFKLRLTNNGFD
jgi:hypothetical protein